LSGLIEYPISFNNNPTTVITKIMRPGVEGGQCDLHSNVSLIGYSDGRKCWIRFNVSISYFENTTWINDKNVYVSYIAIGY